MRSAREVRIHGCGWGVNGGRCDAEGRDRPSRGDSLFNRFGCEVVDVEEIGIHGGSIRIYVSRLGASQPSKAVGDVIDAEENDRIFA